MQLKNVVFCLLLFGGNSSLFGQALESAVKDRMDDFFVNVRELRKGYCCVGRIVSVSRSEDPEELGIGYGEIIFRKAFLIDDGKELLRIDIAKTESFSSNSPVVYEHDLVLPDRLFHGFDSKIGANVRERSELSVGNLDDLVSIDPLLCTRKVGSYFKRIDLARDENDWNEE